MSQDHLTYCCSNPECHTKFTLEQATTADGLIFVPAKATGNAVPWEFSLVHILCPKCKNIVSSIHIPVDPL